MRASTDVEGMDELIKMFNELGKAPKKYFNKAVKSSAELTLERAREGAKKAVAESEFKMPFDGDMLAKGIILVKEKSSIRTKSVIQVAFDEKMDEVFARDFGKKKNGKQKRAYYPAWLEYGYTMASGRRIAGKYYMRNSIKDHVAELDKKMVTDISAQIDKIIK